jgi:hypothetical protein
MTYDYDDESYDRDAMDLADAYTDDMRRDQDAIRMNPLPAKVTAMIDDDDTLYEAWAKLQVARAAVVKLSRKLIYPPTMESLQELHAVLKAEEMADAEFRKLAARRNTWTP